MNNRSIRDAQLIIPYFPSMLPLLARSLGMEMRKELTLSVEGKRGSNVDLKAPCIADIESLMMKTGRNPISPYEDK